MIVRYEVSMDDIVAWNRHHLAQSRTVQNQKYICIFLVIAALIGASLLLEAHIPRATLVAWAVLTSILFVFLYPITRGRFIERLTRKLLAEGSTEGIFGTHELEIDENSLTERTDVNESRHSWKSLDRIEETDDYVFIYVTGIQAHTIPKASVTAGDIDRFLAESRRYYESARESTA